MQERIMSLTLVGLVVLVTLLAWWPGGKPHFDADHLFQDVDVGGEDVGLVSHSDDGLPLRDVHDKS